MSVLKTGAAGGQWSRNQNILRDAAVDNAQQEVMTGEVLHYRQELEKLRAEYAKANEMMDPGVRVAIRGGRDKNSDDDLDSDDEALLNDPELDAEIRAKIEKEHETSLSEWKKQQVKLSHGHGQYSEMEEKEFLDMAGNTDFVVVHFYLDEVERCKIVDKHLKLIAHENVDCRFVKINASKANFLSARWRIRTLPTICILVHGVLVHKYIGFDAFGGTDDFTTTAMHRAFAQTGVIKDISGTRRKRNQRTSVLS